MDWTTIITSLIVAGVPACVTLVTSFNGGRNSKMNHARSNILQLILEDKINVMEGKLPENHKAILDEYDRYKKNGGNSYVVEKVEDYLKWYKKTNKKGGKSA